MDCDFDQAMLEWEDLTRSAADNGDAARAVVQWWAKWAAAFKVEDAAVEPVEPMASEKASRLE